MAAEEDYPGPRGHGWEKAGKLNGIAQPLLVPDEQGFAIQGLTLPCGRTVPGVEVLGREGEAGLEERPGFAGAAGEQKILRMVECEACRTGLGTEGLAGQAQGLVEVTKPRGNACGLVEIIGILRVLREGKSDGVPRGNWVAKGFLDERKIIGGVGIRFRPGE